MIVEIIRWWFSGDRRSSFESKCILTNESIDVRERTYS